jgi:hypothetical protein
MASSKTETRNNGVTHEQFRVIQKVTEDPFYFSSFANVIHPVRGRVSFSLYPYQKSVLWYFLTNRFNIVLKFRQAGLTELIALYCLWLAMYHDNKNIIIISIKDRVAKKVLRRIRFLYRNLPWYLQTPVINGRPGELGTQCITPDTVLRGSIKDFKIGEIIPLYPGIMDISRMDLRVLTHNGTFEKVTKTINKGYLETWEIENERGNILKCTPDHRLLTIDGWRSVKDIINHNLTCIFQDNSYLDNIKPPLVKPPETEIIKETKFSGYFVSNMGKVYSKMGLGKRKNKLVLMNTRISNGERVKLKGSGNGKFYHVHRLVWETFNGPIPDNLVVDHINCNRSVNHINNLQLITHSENIARAYKYNRILTQNNHRLDNISLQTLGKLKYLVSELKPGYGTGALIAKELGLTTKEVSHYTRGLSGNTTYISKIKVNRKFTELICDLEIENYHSYITKSDYVNHNTEMEFSNGSTITSIPTTEDAGRSEAVSLLVIDEAAIVRWAAQIWAAAFPTLSTGGSAILNSTPYGVGNFFHKTWVDAVARGNEFIPIRLKWQMHPERDLEWYRIMSSSLGPRRTAQEIDGDFLTSGNSVFDLVDIKAIEDLITEMPPYDVRHNGNMVIIKPPQKGHHYYIAADIASGRSRDYSAFTVMDRAGVEHAYFKGKMPVAQFANLLMSTGKDYNRAVLAPESNDIGLAVTTKIQESGYPNLFYTTRFLKEKGESKPKVEKIPGWYTTLKTRPIIIDELEDDIRNERVEILNKFFVQEAYTFIYDDRNRPVAMGKHSRGSEEDDLLDDETTYTDDSIMSEAICNYIRKGKVTTSVVSPT